MGEGRDECGVGWSGRGELVRDERLDEWAEWCQWEEVPRISQTTMVPDGMVNGDWSIEERRAAVMAAK